jgi:hypothetical protein
MPTFQDFQRMIHTPEFWTADESDREQMWSQYTNVQEADVTPVNAYQLGLLALQEMARLGMIVKALALETPAEPPKRRGRPPRMNGEGHQPRPPKERPISVVADPEAAVVELMDVRLSAEQARDIGEKLLQAAAVVEAINPGREGESHISQFGLTERKHFSRMDAINREEREDGVRGGGRAPPSSRWDSWDDFRSATSYAELEWGDDRVAEQL